jgi:hypothetical protein
MKISVVSICGVLSFLTASLSQAEIAEPKVLEYRINNYPKTANNCHLEARAIAEKFTSVTGVESTGICTEMAADYFNMTIQYSSTNPLPMVTTYPEMILQDRVYVFDTADACRQHLQNEIDHFKETTNLEPFLAFCTRSEIYSDYKPWAIRIDAFGASATQPFWGEGFFMGQPVGMNRTQAETVIAESFRQAGVDVRFVSLRTDNVQMLQFSMLYYSPKSLDIRVKDFAKSDTRAHCEAQLEHLRSWAAEVSPHALFCTEDRIMSSFEIAGVVNMASWYKDRESVESFKTYDECEAGRESLTEFYRTQLGYNIAGGLCSKWGAGWKINFLERKAL